MGSELFTMVGLLTMAAAVLSFLFCGLFVWLGPRDAPDEARKVQARPIPTAGGTGQFVAVGLLFAGLAVASHGPLSDLLERLVAWGAIPHLVMIIGLVITGFIDDAFGMKAWLKLLIIVGLCAGASAFGFHAETLTLPGTETVIELSPVVGIAGSALWLIVLINAVNFMDGSNGYAPGMLLIGLAGYAAYFWISLPVFSAPKLIALLVTMSFIGALAGFLVWNMSNKLYMGDAGALGLGALFGSLGLFVLKDVAEHSGPTDPFAGLVWFPAMLALPFLVDVLLTLGWRTIKRERIMSAHREHAYQLFLRAGVRPLWVMLSGWLTAATCTLAATYGIYVLHDPQNAGQTVANVGWMFVALVLGLSAVWLLQRVIWGTIVRKKGA
ncbi:MAG: glycosyltransferase family 4 protein [Hyphomonas sp.]